MTAAPKRTPDLLPGRRFAIALVTLLSFVAIYALLGFLLAPVLIQRSIATFADEQLERKASVGKVRVNPFLFKLELEDFSLTERDGRPILGFARVLADFDALSSLRRWAWTLSELSLEKPDLHVEIGRDGKLNLARLLDKWPKTERRPDEKVPRVLLQRAALRAGRITFTDLSEAKPASTSINSADLELHEISTLPGERGDYSVSARLLDGGAVTWRGEVSLDKLSSQGEIAVKGVKPLTAWRFVQDRLAIAEPKGEFDLSLRYRFAFAGGAPQLTIENGRVAGRGIAVVEADGKEPILALEAMEITGGRLDLAAREFSLAAVTVRDGIL